MKDNNTVLFMLGLLFLAVVDSIFLIFLESKIPVLVFLSFGIIFTIIIDLILLYDKPKKIYKKLQPKSNFGSVYNNLLKTSIDLSEKMDKLNKREQQLKKIAEEAQKTIKLSKEVKKQIKPINSQKKYVASILSSKFHAKTCKFTKLISSRNRIYFTTKNQALKQGFKPCLELKR